MSDDLWLPSVETSEAEKRILKRCKKSKLFIFLREHRHELFDDVFQREMLSTYPARKGGKDAVPPALLAMVTLLQAALHVSDEDAVEFAVMERRWQMVLGTLGTDDSPFSQGSLFNFRMRLMAHDLDRRLLERTVELARKTRGFGATALRAAFDSSPLFGAGRVEDTFNLIGHAVREVLDTVAAREGKTREEVAVEGGIPLLAGTSVKASLDIDWEDRAQKAGALERLVAQVRALGTFLEREQQQALSEPPLVEQWATVQQLIDQDTEPDPQGGGVRIKEGVARERRISVTDRQMRQGTAARARRAASMVTSATWPWTSTWSSPLPQRYCPRTGQTRKPQACSLETSSARARPSPSCTTTSVTSPPRTSFSAIGRAWSFTASPSPFLPFRQV